MYLIKNECPICMNHLASATATILIKCGHLFHEHCIQPWLITNDSCPICRTSCKGKSAIMILKYLEFEMVTLDLSNSIIPEETVNIINTMKAEIHHLTLQSQRISNAENELIHLTNALTQSDTNYKALAQKSKLQERNLIQQIEELSIDLARTNKLNDSLNTQNKQYQASISNLKSNIASITSTLTDLEEKFKDASDNLILSRELVEEVRSNALSRERKLRQEFMNKENEMTRNADCDGNCAEMINEYQIQIKSLQARYDNAIKAVDKLGASTSQKRVYDRDDSFQSIVMANSLAVQKKIFVPKQPAKKPFGVIKTVNKKKY